MIALEGVSVSYAGLRVLRGVSLRVNAGEIVGLVGAAGCGKSTVVKVLCGLRTPDEGRARLDGVDLSHASPAELSAAQGAFGVAFQNLALFDRLSVEENVALPLRRRGVGEDEALSRARRQLAAVGLADAGAKLPHELSGGMRRRAALARALVGEPRACLFDDPFTGLDPVACARIARLIATGTRERGAATLVAASDPAPLLALCDRLLLLDGGVIAFDGPPGEFTRSEVAVVRVFRGAADA